MPFVYKRLCYIEKKTAQILVHNFSCWDMRRIVNYALGRSLYAE